MEIKKSPKADLEGSKQLFVLMGFVVALAFLFVAFEWGTRDVKKVEVAAVGDIIAEEEIDITVQQEVVPPPPPPPAPVVVEALTVVEDDVELEQQEIVTSEDNQKSAQTEVYTPPVQVEEEEEDTNEIFVTVEDMPEFPGGQGELMKYIGKSIKYPVVAQENGIQGRVVVQFVVNKEGKVTDAAVVKGVDPSLDKEALRVVNAMPKWKPGSQRGKPVNVKYTVPVQFRLQ